MIKHGAIHCHPPTSPRSKGATKGYDPPWVTGGRSKTTPRPERFWGNPITKLLVLSGRIEPIPTPLGCIEHEIPEVSRRLTI